MSDRPNVLFLLTDQWRADHTGYAGHPIADTPTVDRLAAAGQWFANAFTTCPLCSPARGTLLSGRWPHQTGLYDNLGVGGSLQTGLDHGVRTWLDAARDAGFRTGYFGKWHLGQQSGEARGVTFDVVGQEADGPRPGQRAPADERGQIVPEVAARLAQQPSRPGDRPPFYALRPDGLDSMRDHRIAERAIGFLHEPDDRPWYCCASWPGPHFPSVLPEPWLSRYAPDRFELPANLGDRFVNKPWWQNRHWWPPVATDDLTADDWRRTLAAYAGYVSLMDHELGRVLDTALAQAGGRETWVVFAADHGEMLGGHSRFDKHAYFYDEVLRIPLVIARLDPDGQPVGATGRRDEYVHLIDLAATLFGLADEACGGDGRDLRESADRPDETFACYHAYNGHSFQLRMLRTPDWKYVFTPQDIDELYDLRRDPGELRNLADEPQHTELLAALRARLFAWMAQTGDPLRDSWRRLPAAGSLAG